MLQYKKLIETVLDNGCPKGDRTGTGTLSLFGTRMEFDLSDGFPLVTGKYVPFSMVVSELLWFLSGSQSVEDLRAIHYGNCFRFDKSKKTIWDEWKTDSESIGPMYGSIWRNWETPDRTVDQIAEVIQNLKTNPNSRRHVVSALNISLVPDESIKPQANVEAGKGALWPCHMFFQFYVDNENKLSCQIYQRSVAVFLGLPFNIASYALLTHLIAQVTRLKVGKLIWVGGDTHIYNNHFHQIQDYMEQKTFDLPRLVINPDIHNIDSFTMDDIELVDYQHGPRIKAPIAI